ncbi:MAG: translation initiation factor IF-2 [Andreesenia angusta]|nr:translation initiation factor IF-2 [Andreesenia angusta]
MKVRIHELAKELGVPAKELIVKLNDFGIEAKSHMNTIDAKEAEAIKELISEENKSDIEKEEVKEKEEVVEKKELKKDQNLKENSDNKKERKKRKRNRGKKRKEEITISENNGNKQEENKKSIKVPDTIQVKELAEKLEISATDIIKDLMNLGAMVTLNEEIDFETAAIIAAENNKSIEREVSDVEDFEAMLEETYNYEDDEDEKLIVERPPIVTVMGHVDHGKTSLLDAIRETNHIKSEAGGITQHIGASTVKSNGKQIVFLDTPGHEAFTSMRARGAQITDVAILVVAADDGVMPQTVEAINHAKAADIPIIVAVNKIDKPTANPEKVMQELTEYGLISEEWGGDTIFVNVSAKHRKNIEELLEMILLVAEVQELKANPNRRAVGTIIEAKLDVGRGAVATVLIEKGTLSIGDAVVIGKVSGRIRAMIDDKGRQIKKAGPSTPVEILGLSEVPESGAKLYMVEDDKMARTIADRFRLRLRDEQMKSTQKVSLDDLFDRIQDGNMKELNIVIKSDVKGTIEAVKQSLLKLSTDEVRVRLIHEGVGGITESDVMLASASNAIIIGFNVRPTNNALQVAKTESVDIRTYRVIYNAIEDIKSAIDGMLEPEYKEVFMGRAEVRDTFKIPNAVVAGVHVISGKITRNSKIRLIRNDVVVYEGELSSLRRFKDDVRELATNYEGGLSIDGFKDVKVGDTVEAYVMEAIKR